MTENFDLGTLSWTKPSTKDPIRNAWFWNVRLDWQLGALHCTEIITINQEFHVTFAKTIMAS